MEWGKKESCDYTRQCFGEYMGIYKSDVSSLRQTVGIRSLHWTWKRATGTPNLLRPNVTGVVIYKHSQAFIWSYMIIYPFSEVNPWVTKPTVQSISQRHWQSLHFREPHHPRQPASSSASGNLSSGVRCKDDRRWSKMIKDLKLSLELKVSRDDWRC